MKVTPDLEEDSSKILTFAIGISMLTFALFMSARMGIYQEVIYSKYGKHAKEALYYSHCLPLVGFIILYKGILILLNFFNISNYKLLISNTILTTHNFLNSRYIQPPTHRHQLRIDSSTVTTYGDCSQITALSYW